jgi:hypothetical protein
MSRCPQPAINSYVVFVRQNQSGDPYGDLGMTLPCYNAGDSDHLAVLMPLHTSLEGLARDVGHGDPNDDLRPALAGPFGHFPKDGFGSSADIEVRAADVRFTPKSGHRSARWQCPLCANSRHATAFETVPPGALEFRHLRRLCQRDYAERTAARASQRSCASMPSAIAMTKMITGSDSVARFVTAGPGHSPTRPQPTPNRSAPNRRD